ncbi:hypothetical protein H6776_02525 [Candidatus Nomurabacteria bacterium]|nr:hypothetical protein [Candidatus Nomurabacteria bacterium]
MQHIQSETFEKLKTMLLDEQQQLEEALSDNGRVIATDGDWAAVPPKPDESEEDYTVQADRMEEFFTRGAAVSELEARLGQVKEALSRMDKGTYGLSEKSQEPIEVERLLANPAATTTISEMEKEGNDV